MADDKTKTGGADQRRVLSTSLTRSRTSIRSTSTYRMTTRSGSFARLAATARRRMRQRSSNFNNEEAQMKIAVVLTSFAVLVGADLASAQTPAEQSSPSKCWDAAANQLRTKTEPTTTQSPDDMPETTVGEGSSEGMSAIAPGSKGPASKTLPGSSSNPTGSRPPGFPNC
jgi:hypothetical protein